MMMMMMFRSCSLSQPLSALSALSALLVCALCMMLATVVESQKISSSSIMHSMHSMHGLGCTTKTAEDGSSRKVCATAFESSSLEHDTHNTHNRITHKEIHIENLNATINVSYHGEKCRINYNGQMCSSCYLCADNEIAYDCANLPNGRCTVQKCERILQLADPTEKHPHGKVKQFMLPVDLGQNLPLPRKCDILRFPVLADTWTNPKHPNQSMEEKKRLRMSNTNRYSLIKFKVTNLMDGVSQGVSDAFLKIKTVDNIPSLSVRLPEGGYANSGIANDTWDEELKTYHFLSGTSLVDNMVDFEQNSKPIATKKDLLGRHWYSFDVSNVVTKNGVYTFLLKTDTPGIIVGVYGKGTDYEPELIVRPVLPYIPIGKNTLPPTSFTLPPITRTPTSLRKNKPTSPLILMASDIPSSFPTESNIPSSSFPSLSTTPPVTAIPSFYATSADSSGGIPSFDATTSSPSSIIPSYFSSTSVSIIPTYATPVTTMAATTSSPSAATTTTTSLPTGMEDQNYKGYCVDGYYGGNKMDMMGLNDPDDIREDLQKCLEQCMAETECRYAAFRMGTACSRFKENVSGLCDTNEGRTSDDNFNLYKRVAP